MKHCVYISLGSNLGHRLAHLRNAVDLLYSKLNNITSSFILETKAIFPKDAPIDWNMPHLNMIIKGYTQENPEELLFLLKSIETKLGRKPQHPRWSPRIIDLDILLYDDIVLSTDLLTIPHPEIKNRGFLLHLLASLNPDLKDPVSDEKFSELAQKSLLLPAFKRSFVLYPQLMGIVNITPDSFSDGGLYSSTESALQHCQKLIDDGASLLDIGAQSTRPNSSQIGALGEWERLHPLLNALDLKKIPVSIDTYRDDLIEKLLNHYPIAWINDVSGRLKTSTLHQIAEAGCKICIMHSLSVPPQKDENITEPWKTLDQWCQQQIEKLTTCGFELKDIVLDPGFGFGKTPYQTGFILKTIEHLNRWNCPILIGHSRKSFYNILCNREASQRDIETLAVSQFLKDKVTYLRVHNVELHQRFLSTQHWIESCHENSDD